MQLKTTRVRASLGVLLGVCGSVGVSNIGLTAGAAGAFSAPAHTRASFAATPRPAMLTAADRASFARLASSLGGRSGVAVSPLGMGQRVQAAGTFRSAVAWSTAKVPIAMAVVTAGGGTSRQGDLRQAITASDNAAAERMWSSLGAPSVAASKATDQLRVAGDRRTVVQSQRLRADFTAFGQSSWRLTDQARFTAGMPCLAAGKQALALMGKVIPAHRWGLGATKAKARFKGGWGPGTNPGGAGGYIDRQMGVLTVRGKPFAVTIATAPADGTHETGSQHLTTIARWVVTHVGVRGIPAKARCS